MLHAACLPQCGSLSRTQRTGPRSLWLQRCAFPGVPASAGCAGRLCSTAGLGGDGRRGRQRWGASTAPGTGLALARARQPRHHLSRAGEPWVLALPVPQLACTCRLALCGSCWPPPSRYDPGAQPLFRHPAIRLALSRPWRCPASCLPARRGLPAPGWVPPVSRPAGRQSRAPAASGRPVAGATRHVPRRHPAYGGAPVALAWAVTTAVALSRRVPQLSPIPAACALSRRRAACGHVAAARLSIDGPASACLASGGLAAARLPVQLMATPRIPLTRVPPTRCSCPAAVAGPASPDHYRLASTRTPGAQPAAARAPGIQPPAALAPRHAAATAAPVFAAPFPAVASARGPLATSASPRAALPSASFATVAGTGAAASGPLPPATRALAAASRAVTAHPRAFAAPARAISPAPRAPPSAARAATATALAASATASSAAQHSAVGTAGGRAASSAAAAAAARWQRN